MAETRVDDPGSETHTPAPHSGRHPGPEGVHPDRDHPRRHHGGRGRHLLHRGRQGLPHPAAVLLLVRQVHARRVVVHAPQVRQPDLRPLLLDGSRRGRDVVPDRAPHLPGLLELADARLAPAPRRLVAPRRALGRVPDRRPAPPGHTRGGDGSQAADDAVLARDGLPVVRGRLAGTRPGRGLPLLGAHGPAHGVHARRVAAADRGHARLDVAGRALAASGVRGVPVPHASGRRPDRVQRAAVVHALARGGRGVGGLRADPLHAARPAVRFRDRGVVADHVAARRAPGAHAAGADDVPVRAVARADDPRVLPDLRAHPPVPGLRDVPPDLGHLGAERPADRRTADEDRRGSDPVGVHRHDLLPVARSRGTRRLGRARAPPRRARAAIGGVAGESRSCAIAW